MQVRQILVNNFHALKRIQLYIGNTYAKLDVKCYIVNDP